jgi:hypothetical protein
MMKRQREQAKRDKKAAKADRRAQRKIEDSQPGDGSSETSDIAEVSEV